MDLSEFNVEGAQHVSVTRYTLGGEGHHSVVTECTLVVEYEDHDEEMIVPFGDNPPALATLLALIRVLNERLAAGRV